uniref:Cys2/His2 zinc-finger transcription factor n=1 Tax=Silene latifolia TaxID=37657 RepID=Q4U318_SILLA|nr:Cys2/His2 zinc-finger transcription factor [Silene latifolia]
MDSITDEELYGSTSFTTKGRRTKRRRVVTTSTHGAENCLGNISYGSSSNSATPSTIDDHEIMSEVTTEEEDLANCLILLAQGLQNRPPSNINIGSSGSYERPSLRKLIVIDNNDVYECKTCNKTFSSFQALGGHRTSHKKIVKPTPPPTPPPKPEDGQQNEGATNKSRSLRNIDTAKMHECSICGSEFRSGQALGGHMRRHRSSAVAPTVVASSSTSTAEIDSGGTRNILSLDLNLPAPHDHEDDDHMVETLFHVILPTPALVDCHY